MEVININNYNILLIPSLLLCLILTSCAGNGTTPDSKSDQAESSAEVTSDSSAADQSEASETSQPESKPDAEPSGETDVSPAEISEKAMENFLAKVDAGNYTIDSGNHVKVSVFSRDQVYFDYVEETYYDYAVMSVNNEAFQALLKEGGLDELTFMGEGQAVDVAKAKLLNNWTSEEVSDGNIYNLFYNQQDDPLTFVSYEDAVKQTLKSLAGLSDFALQAMHEVYMVMDSEDPTEVHLKAEMEDDEVARIYYDDIDMVVKFGDAVSNAQADEWMENPTYPDAKTDWDEGDEFILNSVFLPGYGREAVPFPTFASYALLNDDKNFVMDDQVTVRDSHATEDDVAGYIDILKQNGFEEVKETDEEHRDLLYR